MFCKGSVPLTPKPGKDTTRKQDDRPMMNIGAEFLPKYSQIELPKQDRSYIIMKWDLSLACKTGLTYTSQPMQYANINRLKGKNYLIVSSDVD
jgi:hypothetical protein